ncbi:MAG: DUF2959 family protein [Phycisphaera sp.]|nr:DUF2959 family protein [Phycisphaera sp.]
MQLTTLRRLLTLSVSALAVMLGGCETVGRSVDNAYYATMETVGVHKRDILVDRVEEARDAQSEAKQAFQSALDQFRSVVKFEGGELETEYNKLNNEYELAKSSAETVRTRIASIESVSEALFREWAAELDEYKDPDLRAASQRQLGRTRQVYKQMVIRMQIAEEKMQPVLDALHDRVLFLKHNLNASAIASLEGEVVKLEDDVKRLIEDMEASIDEANKFIEQMGTK